MLDKQRALILADFDCIAPTAGGRYPYSMAEVTETLRHLLPYPVLTGLPFGHIHEKVTIPPWRGVRRFTLRRLAITKLRLLSVQFVIKELLA